MASLTKTIQSLNTRASRAVQAHQAAVILDTSVPDVPRKSFKKFNRVVGQPILPATGEPSDIFDYQERYEEAWNLHHKVILNKSRKIGATETALRIIAYNCMNGTYMGHHRVMIVAGNKQEVANRFLARFKAIFGKGFTDLNGVFWSTAKTLTKEDKQKGHKLLFADQGSAHKLKLYNGIHLQAYPANESVRGEENVICVFISEAAFSNLLDDSKVYNAVHPNVANIADADFIMESTPNGKRGYFWELGTESDGPNEYYYLEQPYTVSMGKLLDEDFIEKERHNTKIDFEQEYNCKFTTSLSSVFKEEDIRFEPKKINNYDDL
jgi:hypothetical protein